MKKKKWVIGILLLVVIAAIAGGLALRPYENEEEAYLTQLDADNVEKIRVTGWTYAIPLSLEFTEREEIEKLISDWNTVKLEPIDADAETETSIRYMVTFKFATGDTDAFGLGEDCVYRYPYGRIDSKEITKYIKKYRVDPRIYKYFFEEYEMKSPDFDYEAYEKSQRMKEIEEESQKRLEKKKETAEKSD